MTKYGCNISSVDFFGWLDNSSFGAGGIHILVTDQRLWDRIIMICGEIKIGLQILLWECRSLERQYMNEYKCMISGWMIQQSCQTLQTPLFSSQLKVQLQRLKVRASVSKGWSSWHPAPEVATPDIQLQRLKVLAFFFRGWKERVFFAQLSLLLWFSAALGAALFTTQWPASTGFEDNSLPYNID